MNNYRPLEDRLRREGHFAREGAPPDLLPRLTAASAHAGDVFGGNPFQGGSVRRLSRRMLPLAGVIALLAGLSVLHPGRSSETRPPQNTAGVPASAVLNESLDVIPRSARRLAEIGTKPLREPIGLLSRGGKSKSFGL